MAGAGHACGLGEIVDGDEVTLVDTGSPKDRERVIVDLAQIGTPLPTWLLWS